MKMTRRESLRLLSAAAAAACLWGSHTALALESESVSPALAPGNPNSPERLALIEAFNKRSEGLQNKFEARTHKSDWVMPYRLFRPKQEGKLPLVVYLHGSGGLGNDNLKQLALGNTFGTRLWLLPGNQKAHPCYVLAPQTDRGWVHYDAEAMAKGVAKILPGLGDGARLVLEIVDGLRHELSIDDRRIYVAGQSMGGAGTWNIMTNRPGFFAAAVVCCGSVSTEDGTGSLRTPMWCFQGDADQTVPVQTTRDRIAARRKAGGHPLYTEYAGVDHNVYEWAFTEPALVKWLFEQKLST